MYSPRAVHRPPSAKPPPFPKGGKALPKNSADLMKALRSLEGHVARMQSTDSMDIVESSADDLTDSRTQAIERKLMQLEDYVFTDEGKRRFARIEEERLMILEDLRSQQVREAEDLIAFNNRIRVEAAERQRLEALEREKRRKAAEERRRLVVARIRKAQEDEARRILEAELAKQRIIEEKERARQEAINRLITDRKAMAFEDALSRLAEEERQEEEAKRAFLSMEAKKLDEWERLQKEKDKVEEAQRAERLRALEAKKAKLQALGASLPSSAATSVSAAAAREEANKLNKQLRIQNKAKFVSKRIKAGKSVNQAVSEVSGIDGTITEEETTPSGKVIRVVRVAGEAVGGDADQESGDELGAFILKLQDILSETELRDLQKELMGEKRKLRLEQRQRPSGGAAAGAAAAKELRAKLKLVAQKEEAVQKRIDELVKGGPGGLGGGGGDAADVGGDAPATPMKMTIDVSVAPLSPALKSPAQRRLSRQASASAFVEIALSRSISFRGNLEERFKAAEILIAESAECAKVLDSCIGGAGSPSKGSKGNLTPRTIAHQQRKAALLEMKLQEMVKGIPPGEDVTGFKDRLSTASLHLVNALKKSEVIAPLGSAAVSSAAAAAMGVAAGSSKEQSAASQQVEIALAQFIALHGTPEDRLKAAEQLIAESNELTKAIESSAATASSGVGNVNPSVFAAQLRRASLIATKLHDLGTNIPIEQQEALGVKDKLAAASIHLMNAVKKSQDAVPMASTSANGEPNAAGVQVEIAVAKFMAQHGTADDRLKALNQLLEESADLSRSLQEVASSSGAGVDSISVATKQRRAALLTAKIEDLMKSLPIDDPSVEATKEKLITAGIHLVNSVKQSERAVPLSSMVAIAGDKSLEGATIVTGAQVEVTLSKFLAHHGSPADQKQAAEDLIAESEAIRQALEQASAAAPGQVDAAAVAAKQHRAAVIASRIENLLKNVPTSQSTAEVKEKLISAGIHLAHSVKKSEAVVPLLGPETTGDQTGAADDKNGSAAAAAAEVELVLANFVAHFGNKDERMKALDALITESNEVAGSIETALKTGSADVSVISAQQRRASLVTLKIQELMKSIPSGQEATAAKDKLSTATAQLATAVMKSDAIVPMASVAKVTATATSIGGVPMTEQRAPPVMEVFAGTADDRVKAAEMLVADAVDTAKLLSALTASPNADVNAIAQQQRHAALTAIRIQDLMRSIPGGQEVPGFKELLTTASTHLCEAVSKSEAIVPLSATAAAAAQPGPQHDTQVEMALSKFITLHGTPEDRVHIAEALVTESVEVAKSLEASSSASYTGGAAVVDPHVIAKQQQRAAMLESKIKDLMKNIPAGQEIAGFQELLSTTSKHLVDAVKKSEALLPLSSTAAVAEEARVQSGDMAPVDAGSAAQIELALTKLIAQHGTVDDRLKAAEQLLSESLQLAKSLNTASAPLSGQVDTAAVSSHQHRAAILELRIQSLMKSIPVTQDSEGVQQRLQVVSTQLVDAVKNSENVVPLGYIPVDAVGISPREEVTEKVPPSEPSPYTQIGSTKPGMPPPSSPSPYADSVTAAAAAGAGGSSSLTSPGKKAITIDTNQLAAEQAAQFKMTGIGPPPVSEPRSPHNASVGSGIGNVSMGIDFYKSAEHLMTEATEIARILEKAARSGRTDDEDLVGRTTIATHKRNAQLLQMKINELAKTINEEEDVAGFRDRLKAICTRVEDVMSGKYLENLPPEEQRRGGRGDENRSYSVSSAGSASVSARGGLFAEKAGSRDDEDGLVEEVVADPEESDSDFGGENFEDVPGWEECINTTMATAAHHAAFYGYVGVIELLARYFDCFVLDEKGRTPLFYAALQNRLEVVAFLVRLDPQWIDVGDSRGDTPLHAAAVSSVSSNAEVLRFLLSCEASPDIANFEGLTPCHLAKTVLALSCLVEAGAVAYCVDNKSRTPLYVACAEGRDECSAFLCKHTPAEFLLWCDNDGDNCLHIAARNGHHKCVEVLCEALTGVDDLNCPNKKEHTPAHVASTAQVLQKLYEHGADMWVTDIKGRYPLFVAAFLGRVDCVSFLLELGNGKAQQQQQTKVVGGKMTSPRAEMLAEYIGAKDKQGDTALHASCLCGHIQCSMLLIYFLRCEPNSQGLRPDQLAGRAGHAHLARIVNYVDNMKAQNKTSAEIFGCSFEDLSAVTLYYGSRWVKLYDVNANCVYYFDRVTGVSQWERPVTYDESPRDEIRTDKAREILHKFYTKYNPSKLKDMNEILAAFRQNYTELFISLVERYQVEDLSMFAGVSLD